MSPNERTQITPPRGCVSCWHYVETSGSNQPTRYECAHGHPMHEMCGWRTPKTAPIPGVKH